jgi:hypothetical protein
VIATNHPKVLMPSSIQTRRRNQNLTNMLAPVVADTTSSTTLSKRTHFQTKKVNVNEMIWKLRLHPEHMYPVLVLPKVPASTKMPWKTYVLHLAMVQNTDSPSTSKNRRRKIK